MLRIFEKKPSTDDLVDVLEEDGAVVIYDMAEHHLLDQIEHDLRQRLEDNRDDFKSEFNGQNTLRVATILAVSRSSAELVAHPFVSRSSRCDFEPLLRQLPAELFGCH
jgi:hypothetical protein